ncbi:MAG: hypothetical protein ACQESK_01200 [Bacteroidota bacterium]
MPAILFVVAIVLEAINAMSVYYFDCPFAVLFGYKLLVLLFFAGIAFKNNQKNYLLILVLSIIYSIGQLTFAQFEFDFLRNLNLLLNYIFVILAILGFRELIHQHNFQLTLKVVVYCVVFLALSILVAAVFDIAGLRTYTYRYGFKGLLKNSAQLSYFIVFAILIVERFKKEINFYKPIMGLLLVCAFLAGTKLPLLFLLFFVAHKIQKREFFNFKKYILALLLAVVGMFFWIKNFYVERFHSTIEIYRELYEKESIWSALSSFRTRKLLQISDYYYNNWEWYNFFVGGRKIYIQNIEMDFFDLLLNFGIIGCLVYLWLFKKVVWNIFPKQYMILFLGLITVSLLSGHLLYNTYIAFYFGVFLAMSYVYQNQSAETKSTKINSK